MRFWFRSTKPASYPVPTDDPVGDLLRAQNRHPYRPIHLHILAYTAGYKTLITQAFVDDENLDSDVVFSATRPLIGDYMRHVEGPPGVAAPWFTLNYNPVMEPGLSELPTPPIK